MDDLLFTTEEHDRTLRLTRRLFRNQWIMAGHVSQIPARGDYFLFSMAGESIIVMRGREGAVQAFYNVCRHRGSRILSRDCDFAPGQDNHRGQREGYPFPRL